MDDVSKFLQDVKEMNARRTEEDETRQKELDEKIQQEKRERQARRAERARSISPQKSSPANTPPPSSHRHTTRLSDTLRLSPAPDRTGSPQSRVTAANTPTSADTMGKFSDPLAKENEPPSLELEHEHKEEGRAGPGSPTSPLGNSNQSPKSLSWQRRPNSQTSEKTRSRPLSMVAAQNASRSSASITAEPADDATPDQPLSRDQIARALGSKDPSWFRQTPDRGTTASAAYRKTQVEDVDTVNMASMPRAQLPGMNHSLPPRDDATTESSPAATHDTQHFRTSGLASPLPLSPAQRLEPYSSQKSDDNNDAIPSRQSSVLSPGSGSGRTSPVRSTSPTKGMGGFVQSAMMKRSDSVKRWSVTSPPGLARADPSMPTRSGTGRMSPTRPGSSRPTSMLFYERTDAQTDAQTDDTPSRGLGVQDKDEDRDLRSVRATKPSGTAAQTVPPLDTTTLKAPEETTPPSSPSKTMDPRRWSPTKASWLETALNKPESPKPKPTPPPTNQPAWMVELNKAKAQKAGNPKPEGGTGSAPATSKYEVRTTGLMQSSPMGMPPKPSPSTLGGLTSPPPVTTARVGHRAGMGSIGGGGTPRSTISSTAENTVKTSPEMSTAGQKDTKSPSTTSAHSPTAGKPKPETPPKKDFRANLKTRQPSVDTNAPKATENEFQSVFGSLRRTQTKNYVAPDELKSNILRGKAALNATAGPKPSEIRDDFKDAILKKKEVFKKTQAEGRGVTRSAAAASSSSDDQSVPEGIARRAELSKSYVPRKESTSTTSGGVAASKPSCWQADRPAGMANREDSSTSISTAKADDDAKADMPVLHKETSAPARLQRPGGGGLADRFNPGLASLLARGPPAMATNGGRVGDEEADQKSAPTAEPSAPGPQLTHMTKGRAQGPRRKAPTSTQQQGGAGSNRGAAAAASAPVRESIKASPPAKPTEPRASVPIRSLPKPETPSKPRHDMSVDSASQKTTSSPTSPSSSLPMSIHEQVAAKAAVKNKPSPLKPAEKSPPHVEPTTPSASWRKTETVDPQKAMSPSLPVATKKPVSSPQGPKPILPSVSTSFNTPRRRRSPSPMKSHFEEEKQHEATEPAFQPSSPKKLDVKRMSRFLDEPNAASSPKAESPPKKEDTPRIESLKMEKKAAAVPTPLQSPTKQARELSLVLDEFFGTPRPGRQYRVDTAEILIDRPRAPKLKSTGMQLFQLFGDGKKMPVPSYNERVLFERDMYICSHEYIYETGKKASEVYFWAGDEVPESAVEDAQLFASREARALGGRLVKLRQGKETSEFLQALGGVVITRRGSSNKYDSLAGSMLCGRRYLGQVTFDEVDFSPASLCSGFAYLMTVQGKCYLWKGKGSDVDELSCARLIGMDLTLTGELVEVEDGNEPASFWEMFEGGGSKPHSADHWRLKPSYDKYCGRLFVSDATSAQQMLEISPFSQSDLQPTAIYVLDAFFEMYIIVGRTAQSQYTAFRNALDFAQEYAILSSSMEDRPFVPVSTVVLEGIPRDLKRVFRKWRNEASPTVIPPVEGGAGALKRGRSLRVVPLTQALQALSE